MIKADCDDLIALLVASTFSGHQELRSAVFLNLMFEFKFLGFVQKDVIAYFFDFYLVV